MQNIRISGRFNEMKEYSKEEKEAVKKIIENEIEDLKQTAHSVRFLSSSDFTKERDNIVIKIMHAASRIDDLYHAYLQEVDFADQVLQELQTVIINEGSDIER